MNLLANKCIYQNVIPHQSHLATKVTDKQDLEILKDSIGG